MDHRPWTFDLLTANCIFLQNQVENVINHSKAKLHYKKTGSGPKVMLLFHGFGQDHRAFKHFLLSPSNDYTYYSFDLFFHGGSEWNNGETPIEKVLWKTIFEKFLAENKIEKFSMIAFSLGCRFALACVESVPDRIDKIYLIAPDGIKISFWYTIATYPWMFRKIFKSMIKHPFSFKIIAHSLYELHLADKSLLKFAEHQMNTLEKRERVYYSWVVFRHLTFDLETLSQLINANKIAVTFIAGKKDPVIKAKNMNGLVKRLKYCSVKILNTGHRGILKDPILSEIVR
jgi:pimeloyl-ACP methyl ester carboxylesterase